MKPILFNTEMTQAILDNRKTVTRRICKDANKYCEPLNSYIDNANRTYAIQNYGDKEHTDYVSLCEVKMPICVGDILYVRETWRERWGMAYANYGLGNAYPVDDVHEIEFKAGGYTCRMGGMLLCPDECTVQMPEEWSKWKPSIHMPKEAARIFLKVTDVRVERLQDITEEQAIKEGCEGVPCDHPMGRYACEDCMNTGWLEPPMLDFMFTWNNTISKQDLDKYGWDANPWVWVIEFEITEATP